MNKEQDQIQKLQEQVHELEAECIRRGEKLVSLYDQRDQLFARLENTSEALRQREAQLEQTGSEKGGE